MKTERVLAGTLHAADDYMPPEANWSRFKVLDVSSQLYRQVRERYILHYLPLVTKIAHNLKKNYPPETDVRDLVNEGVRGLCEALDNFDPSRETKIETFAGHRIRGAILDSLREWDWAPRSVRAGEKVTNRAESRIGHRVGRRAFNVEVAEELGLSEDEFEELRARVGQSTVLSLDELVYREEDNRQIPRVESVKSDDPNVLDLILENENLKHASEFIRDLFPYEELMVIQFHYFSDMTLKETGEVMGVSESRVSQIHTRAIGRLKLIFRDLRDFGNAFNAA